ncbi:MAG: CoA pyrophosphatase [Desulfarculaceae bacterium]|jgi:8-oxo-dGTP pyrophosphatase MutT (NUDIX family)
MTDRLIQTGQTLQDLLKPKEPVRLQSRDSVLAGVLMPLWDPGDEVQVVLTKRNSNLPHHAGQVSFPGGVKELGDQDILATALRETHEEIGIEQSSVQIVARLDQVMTITNFLITPFVGLLDDGVQFDPNPVEVERMVMVPLAKVLDKRNYRYADVDMEGAKLRQMGLSHNGDFIWGATARMLMNLLDRLGTGASKVAVASAAV